MHVNITNICNKRSHIAQRSRMTRHISVAIDVCLVSDCVSTEIAHGIKGTDKGPKCLFVPLVHHHLPKLLFLVGKTAFRHGHCPMPIHDRMTR